MRDRDGDGAVTPVERDAYPHLSGLEPFRITPETGFVMIGERQNITGSMKFRRLIESGDYQGGVEVAMEQVRSGANLIDVNMDADLLDGGPTSSAGWPPSGCSPRWARSSSSTGATCWTASWP